VRDKNLNVGTGVPQSAQRAWPSHLLPRDTGRSCAQEDNLSSPHVLCVGGEDHHLRIPFMLLLRQHGFGVSAAGSGDPAPFARAGMDFHPFQFKRFVNPLADLAAIRTLSALLTRVRPDIAQTYDTKPALLVPFAARSLPDVRVVRIINGRGWLFSSHSPLARSLRPVYRVQHRLAARSTAATVFENNDDRAYFDSHGMTGARGGQVILGTGIDVDGFERALTAAPSPVQLRDKLGLGAAEIVITVTRMTRQKGIPTLLKAAALIHKVRPNVRFVLVGPRESEGPLAVSQAEIDAHAPYVLATGARSDVPALLSTANVFAFPSEYREGVPRVLMEAALAGTPIVTTSMPGCCEIITDGETGCVVPPSAPDVLAEKILAVLKDPESARTMSDRAAERVRQVFSLRAVVASHAALYWKLFERAGRIRLAASGSGLVNSSIVGQGRG
jgi:glycosyltransferase involved in cell wall biosynthesis